MINRFFVLILLCLTACTSLTPTSASIDVTLVPPIRYLALGDSYTIGESVAIMDRWPNQLVRSLEEQGLQTDVTIIAKTGWTTRELRDGLQKQELEPPYDLVSLLIGVNNQFRGYDINEYREQFVFLLNKSIEYAGGDANRVIVLSIPDWSVTPFAYGRNTTQIANDIDAFNAVNRKEAEKAGAHYVDITPVSREALLDHTLIASDGLHPSGRMYAEWVKQTLPEVLKALQ